MIANSNILSQILPSYFASAAQSPYVLAVSIRQDLRTTTIRVDIAEESSVVLTAIEEAFRLAVADLRSQLQDLSPFNLKYQMLRLEIRVIPNSSLSPDAPRITQVIAAQLRRLHQPAIGDQ